MTIPSSEQRQARAVKALVHESGGLEAAACDTGKSKSQIHRYTSPTAPDSITLRDIMILEAIAHGSPGHPQVTQMLCANAHGMFVPLPDLQAHDSPIADGMGKLGKEFGEAMAVMGATLADGQVEKVEARRCIGELDDMIQQALLTRAMFQAILDVAGTEQTSGGA